MSFYSSLILFYPGRSPVRSLGSLRNFCDLIYSTLLFREKDLGVKIVYEANDNVGPKISWNEAKTIGIHEEEWWKPSEWDYIRSGSSWHQLWPDIAFANSLIRRARIALGPLPYALGDELTATSEGGSPYIIPVVSNISLGPAAPGSLDDDPSNECYGDLEISFSGMGYFTWQPLNHYWKSAKQGSNLQKIMQACRDALPARTLSEPNIYKERLGELFLNHEEYQPGDWIVSVSESG